MKHAARVLSLSTIFVLLSVFSAGAAEAPAPARFDNPTTTVFINEIHYDNTGTDAGEAIEIAGPAGTDLTGWSIVLYNGSNGAVYDTDPLSGVIADQADGYGTISISYPSNGIQNGAPDGIALVDASSAVVQFLSYEGTFAAVGGPANGMTSTDIAVLETGSEALGMSLQLTGAGPTYGDFDWNAPATNSFGTVNTGQSFIEAVNQPVVAVCGGPLSTVEGYAASQPVSAGDADGTVIDILINSVTPAPAAGSITLSTLVTAGGVGGTATAQVDVDALVPPGIYAVLLTATNDDSSPQTGTCTLTVNVQDILPIGAVQGAVADGTDGRAHRSPYAPPTGNSAGSTFVAVQGVIYQKTLARTSSGGSQNGFFLQNTAATSDAEANTSDGVFVFMGNFTSLIGGYVPVVGDEVILRTRVTEFFNLTELTSATGLLVVRSGVDLEAELPPFDADPPDDFADAGRYWERREGMRARIVPGSVVLNGRHVFPSTLDGELWLVHPDHEIAGRLGYERRSFRDPHPLDNDPALFDDGNGYRIVLGSLGIKAAANDNSALIAPAGTFDEVQNAPVGGVYFSFSKYQILVEQQLELEDGPDPADNAPPQAFDRTLGYSVAVFNVENLYDFRDDPFDGCDFTGNAGCPGVNPPFDYVPASNGAYQTRLGEIAAQILDELHAPDLILVQEAEDQDICSNAGSFVCGATNNADGKPDTLQELAAAIASLGGPAYDAAYDRDGADDRGIVSGFLYRTDRAELLPAAADDPVLGSSPTVDYRGAALGYNTDVQNPKALNADLPEDVDLSTGSDGTNVFTRPAQVGAFRLWRDGIGTSVFIDVYALSNHFSSTPNARVGQRTEQAGYNAAIVAALQDGDPHRPIVVGGDLNVYPRPDDPFTPGHPLYPSDQLGPLYDVGLVNLYDSLVSQAPSSAYSYVFEGQAQTLDQIFLTPSLEAELDVMQVAHINSDWPADHSGDGPRGTSDHDPQVARLSLLPTLDRLQDLLTTFIESGDISGNNTARILQDRLDRASGFKESGQTSAYLAQLQAFANQVLGFTPKFITEEAGAALAEEADLLRSLGG